MFVVITTPPGSMLPNLWQVRAAKCWPELTLDAWRGWRGQKNVDRGEKNAIKAFLGEIKWLQNLHP